MQNLVNKITECTKKLVESESGLLAAYLLGSIINGSMRADSDIDIGLMMEPGLKMSGLTRVKLSGRFSNEMGRTVDLGEISSKNLVYAREALLKGKLIYTKNEDRANLYRANLLGMYLQYNIDRQEVVNAYSAG